MICYLIQERLMQILIVELLYWDHFVKLFKARVF